MTRQERVTTDKKNYILFLKLSAILAAFCLLVAGAVLWQRKQAYGAKIPFNIIEVAPTKQQAVLGYYIGGDAGLIERGLTEEQMNTFLSQNSSWYYISDYYYFFFNQTGDGWGAGTDFSNCLPPYSVVKENGQQKAVSNELFKMMCLGVGEYDSSKSPYQNLLDNQAALTDFDSKYEVRLEVRTPKELTDEDINKADYIHFNSGTQGGDIKNFDSLIYNKISGNSGAATKMYTSLDCDITFSQAKEIYLRAVDGKISVSLPGEVLRQKEDDNNFNLFKLQMMFNYFHDPCNFKKLFEKPPEGVQGIYIEDDGNLINDEQPWANKWQLWCFDNKTITDSHISSYTEHAAADGNYIPSSHEGLHDNILIYDMTASSHGFFSLGILPFNKVQIILDSKTGSGDNPGNPEDASVHVLEIEPCNTYKFQTADGRKLLAKYLYGDESYEKYLNITYVTPNTLNGMTADLTADYDVIYIGENVDLFGENTVYRKFPYNHMGDIVRTDTLINGLRKEDFSTKEGFQSLLGTSDVVNLSGDLRSNKDVLWNENLKEQWKSGSTATYFLRNMSLIPELENGNTSAGEARFSGNDLTDSMRDQLEEFIKSDMPVIAAGKVMEAAQEVKKDLDNKGSKPQSQADSNIYQVLAENLEKDNRQIYREPDSAVTIADLELPDNRPEVKIHFDENETIAPVQPEEDEDKKVILELERSNSLSFSYEADGSASLTLIIDVNGDGMFTETKGGKSTSSGSGQTDQDKAKELPEDYVYKIPAGEADGEISVDLSSLGLDDEVYQFQLTAVSGDMRSRDRGYFRPIQQKRDIKILQVIPEEGDQWNLQSNNKFMELLRDVTEDGDSTEYGKIEFEAKTCEKISDAGKGLNLDDYDLIIFGMGFDSEELLSGETDITDPDAIEKLREYIEKEKRPVIFTNDSMSYVNSLNYMTPVEKKYVWKQMTVADYQRFTANGTKKLTDDGVNFKKTEYEVGTTVGDNGISVIENLNSQMDKEGVSSDEHIYLSGDYQKNVQGYRKVIAPVKEGTADYQLGAEYRVIFWYSTKDYNIPLYNSSGATGSATCAEVYDFFNGKGFSVEMQSVDRLLFPIKYYNLARGATTLDEFRSSMDSSDTVKWGSWTKRTAYWKDVYSLFLSKGDVVPESRIDTINPVTVAGQMYYLYDGQYLAYPADENTTITCRESWKYAVEETSGSGGEATGKRSYTLLPVAGNDKAMYPDKPAWNYYLTQSFRNTLGMDRYGITITEAGRKSQDKDLGSVRYRNDNKNDGIWKDDELKQLQGFTDGALIEYASQAGLNSSSPFFSGDKGFLYGAENRTSRVEELNPGVISRYPYEIEFDSPVEIKENHAPYYELSLNRQGRKDSGDVTVWYTLASTPTGPDVDQTPDESSAYFDTTRKDASNNYYLYSNGNVFYTGFSIYGDSAEDSKDGRTEETKLFINTIYAALKTSNPRKDETVYTVVKEDGETGTVYISKEAGGSSRYVHYYDEDDNRAEIYFCLEKQEAAGETAAIRIGVVEKNGDEEVFKELDADSYTVTAEADNTEAAVDLSAFPLVPFPEEGNEPQWIKLNLTWEANNPAAWDGKILAVQVMGNGGAISIKNPKAVHAEILMVCRELFDLD